VGVCVCASTCGCGSFQQVWEVFPVPVHVTHVAPASGWKSGCIECAHTSASARMNMFVLMWGSCTCMHPSAGGGTCHDLIYIKSTPIQSKQDPLGAHLSPSEFISSHLKWSTYYQRNHVEYSITIHILLRHYLDSREPHYPCKIYIIYLLIIQRGPYGCAHTHYIMWVHMDVDPLYSVKLRGGGI